MQKSQRLLRYGSNCGNNLDEQSPLKWTLLYSAGSIPLRWKSLGKSFTGRAAKQILPLSATPFLRKDLELEGLFTAGPLIFFFKRKKRKILKQAKQKKKTIGS